MDLDHRFTDTGEIFGYASDIFAKAVGWLAFMGNGWDSGSSPRNKKTIPPRNQHTRDSDPVKLFDVVGILFRYVYLEYLKCE